VNNPSALSETTGMPPRSTDLWPAWRCERAPVDPFRALDEEFEVVQQALDGSGLEPREAHELGTQLMVAVWRWSARYNRSRPGRTDLTRIAAQVFGSGRRRSLREAIAPGQPKMT
jgi:hypothetical protein